MRTRGFVIINLLNPPARTRESPKSEEKDIPKKRKGIEATQNVKERLRSYKKERERARERDTL